MPIKPNSGESKDDFMSRCKKEKMDAGHSATESQDMCEMIWDEHKTDKTMKTVNLSTAFVRTIPANVDESRMVEFVISDSTRDRHKTKLNSKGWQLDNYLRNPIVGYNHNVYGGSFFANNSPDNVIGKSSVSIENDMLIGQVVFEPHSINPLAEKIFQKVKFGTLRAASVGFIEIGKGKFGEGDEERGGKNETYYFEGQELLEWSIVNIPSNPSATKRNSYKEPTIETILNEFSRLSKEFNPDELKAVSIIDLLRSMEGIIELKLTKKAEPLLLRAAEAKLRAISK